MRRCGRWLARSGQPPGRSLGRASRSSQPTACRSGRPVRPDQWASHPPERMSRWGQPLSRPPERASRSMCWPLARPPAPRFSPPPPRRVGALPAPPRRHPHPGKQSFPPHGMTKRSLVTRGKTSERGEQPGERIRFIASADQPEISFPAARGTLHSSFFIRISSFLQPSLPPDPPSLPGARPRADVFRRGGRESKFLAERRDAAVNAWRERLLPA